MCDKIADIIPVSQRDEPIRQIFYPNELETTGDQTLTIPANLNAHHMLY